MHLADLAKSRLKNAGMVPKKLHLQLPDHSHEIVFTENSSKALVNRRIFTFPLKKQQF